MKTENELKNIFTLSKVKTMFENKNDAISFFETLLKCHDLDLKTLDEIRQDNNIINFNKLHKVSINNHLISSTIDRYKNELQNELKQIVLDQKNQTLLKIKIIESLNF